jgi:hypothetical protein
VFDLKQSGIFAAVAFVFSFLIGLISRSTMPLLIIRPLIFAVIFFALSAFIKILISRFLPELLGDGAQDDGVFKPGSTINILEEDTPSESSALAEGFISGALGQASGAKPDDSEDDLGDISDLSRRLALSSAAEGTLSGIDQNAKEEYTDKGDSGGSIGPDFSNMFGTESPFGAPAGSQERTSGTGASVGASTKSGAGAKAGGRSNSDESLADLDSMAEAFSSGSSDQGSEASEYSVPVSPKRSSSDKTPKWTEDFSGKEIAMGIRSVLKKDKEG